ncbi:hypothetical protein SAMN04489735_104613 [Aneurinibacillus thermoaerophilus]|uniref:Uncharacterized protein n=2 Tax=Aneurinibacillus group TaxID=85151 RepID=A0A1G8ENA4_ANETH|nr:hypothetical protein SAMN04489735_104613 [Aneurinibacillus thermoaerophilus]
MCMGMAAFNRMRRLKAEQEAQKLPDEYTAELHEGDLTLSKKEAEEIVRKTRKKKEDGEK